RHTRLQGDWSSDVCSSDLDTVARFGGDEFVVVCEDLTDERGVVAIAERIMKAVGQPVSVEGRELFVTASMGIALSGTENEPEARSEERRVGKEGRSRVAG